MRNVDSLFVDSINGESFYTETGEDKNRSFTFTDKEGHLLLERRLNGTTTHDTYYVYDIYGNLRYVLQPMYQQTADLAKYAFQYTYDNRNRCTRKQMPGTEYVEYVYDNYDRLTFSQDGKQRTTGRWTYYQYDKFNRLTVQGECTGKNASASPTVHVRNYYDNYDFAGTTGFPTTQFTKDTSGYGKGMLTGSEERAEQSARRVRSDGNRLLLHGKPADGDAPAHGHGEDRTHGSVHLYV